MTPLKALAFAAVFAACSVVAGITAPAAFALNDDAAPGARNASGPTLDRAQASPKSSLSREERKAKRKHRRMMKRQRQLDRQLMVPLQ